VCNDTIYENHGISCAKCIPIPAAPALNIFAVTENGFMVSWNAVGYAERYNAELRVSGETSVVTDYYQTGTSITFSGLNPGTVYEVKVWGVWITGGLLVGNSATVQVTTKSLAPLPTAEITSVTASENPDALYPPVRITVSAKGTNNTGLLVWLSDNPNHKITLPPGGGSFEFNRENGTYTVYAEAVNINGVSSGVVSRQVVAHKPGRSVMLRYIVEQLGGTAIWSDALQAEKVVLNGTTWYFYPSDHMEYEGLMLVDNEYIKAAFELPTAPMHRENDHFDHPDHAAIAFGLAYYVKTQTEYGLLVDMDEVMKVLEAMAMSAVLDQIMYYDTSNITSMKLGREYAANIFKIFDGNSFKYYFSHVKASWHNTIMLSLPSLHLDAFTHTLNNPFIIHIATVHTHPNTGCSPSTNGCNYCASDPRGLSKPDEFYGDVMNFLTGAGVYAYAEVNGEPWFESYKVTK
jgi:hypothetical protein